MQSGMPVPSGPNAFVHNPVPVPVLSEDPAKARPIGVGPVSIAHDLILQIGLKEFVSRVDIYFIMYMPGLSDTLFFLQPDGSLVPFPAGFAPWKAGKTGPVNEKLFGTIPLSLLPSGDYVFFLFVLPKGTSAESLGKHFYLWTTTVENLRVSDMANRAVSLGGDAKAAATIIMALARGYPLKDVAVAIMDGKLKPIGDIIAGTTKALRISEEDLPPICTKGEDIYDCRKRVAGALRELEDQMDDALERWNKAPAEFERLITAYTLYLAGLGYSGEQIYQAIQGSLFGSEETSMTFSNCDGFPIGGIQRSDARGCIGMIEPENTSAEFLSDMDLEHFDSYQPGTEGMTFPAYYKGTGSATLFYSNPTFGEVDCVMENLVYVAKVGGIGYWDGRLQVLSDGCPGTTSTGELECQPRLWACRVARGLYTSDGKYYENFSSDTFGGFASLGFNKHALWGGVVGTEILEVYKGTQTTVKEWTFDLYECSEAEYNAVAGE